MYDVEFTANAESDLGRLDAPIAHRVLTRLRWLTENFDSVRPEALSGQWKGMFKLRVGDYRVLYTCDRAERKIVVHLVGHRLFVNSTNIIEKTRDNFLNPASIKYLFNRGIHIANRSVQIAPVENFESVNPNDVNICFTTIQKLHSDLTIEKENAITFEDFRKHKVVLIADEAHHMNVATKSQQEMFLSWENTVERIFHQNADNLLLEFTATHDYETPAMVEKYRNKVLYRYDLLQYRNDRFSKDVVIVQSDFALNERILQALILSQYKQEVAAKYQIRLKPVILFKAQRTIRQSLENKVNFHTLIDGLTAGQIARIRKSDIPLVQRAFQFFNDHNIGDTQLAERLKRAFQQDYCVSVNEEKEKENYQILVNTLEDRDNHIRAIFAVQKLNEGWDVLNLFDIVRCYETRDSGKNRIGKTTVSEAQLIGRGARYFPFVLPENDDRFRRKLDEDLENELRVLEELHYHSINDSRYVSELRTALVKEGIIDEQEISKELTLKNSFKATTFYQHGLIYLNSRIKNRYEHVQSFSDMKIYLRNYQYSLATGRGVSEAILNKNSDVKSVKKAGQKDVAIRNIPIHIIKNAIARNPFFSFSSIKTYFPSVKSVRQFIEDENYLGGLEITFQGDERELSLLSNQTLLNAMLELLDQIESELRKNIVEYRGTETFKEQSIDYVFTDKNLKLPKNSERTNGDEFLLSDKDWYASNANYGTKEEKDFVYMLDREIETLKEKYDEVYLVRNERHFKIYSFDDGQAFEPDFVLFLREKDGNMLTHQIFVEPKGKHLQEHDKWKQDFLKQVTDKFEGETLEFKTQGRTQKYRLVGVPFYNNEDENKFKQSLYEAIKR